MNQQSPTTWRLNNLLFGSLLFLLSSFMYANARTNNHNWQAGFTSGLGAAKIASVFFKHQQWAWDEEEKK